MLPTDETRTTRNMSPESVMKLDPSAKLIPSTTPISPVIFDKNRSVEKLVQKLCVANGCTYNTLGVVSIIYATTVILLF